MPGNAYARQACGHPSCITNTRVLSVCLIQFQNILLRGLSSEAFYRVEGFGRGRVLADLSLVRPGGLKARSAHISPVVVLAF